LEFVALRMTHQIHAVATVWAAQSVRSLATLGTKLTNDSRIFDKLAANGTCTTKTFEKLLSYFRNPMNWPDRVIPADAAALLENFENIASAEPAQCQGADACASAPDSPADAGASDPDAGAVVDAARIDAGDVESCFDHEAENAARTAPASTGQCGQLSRNTNHEGIGL
jgi:hypothetical protein